VLAARGETVFLNGHGDHEGVVGALGEAPEHVVVVEDVAAAECDLVLVIGSGNSSHWLRLVEAARREGARAHLIEDAGAIDLAWLAAAGTVGIMAGASAPPHLVDDVVTALAGLGPVTVREVRAGTEHIRFQLPKEVSQVWECRSARPYGSVDMW
jgi:4-hydroxy-3-methylbut-2-enyl diphosphate reductase IspH